MSNNEQDTSHAGQMMARLVYSEGSEAERTFRLNPEDPEVLIGRDRACMIRTTRRNVSRRHCAIRWTPDGFEVRDLESANGTFVNGREISRHLLLDNDEIRCGLDFRIWFQFGASDDKISRNHVFLNFDQHILERVEERIQVGRSFVFVPEKLFEKTQPSMSWIASLFGEEANKPRILPLMGPGPIELPGVRIRPMAPSVFRLMSITSDKPLYRAGEDQAHVFVFDPLNPSRQIEVSIERADQKLEQRTLTLDKHGCGVLVLVDLAPGPYLVSVVGPDYKANGGCHFLVSEHRLSSLAAYMEEVCWDGTVLKGVLRVARFTEPVTGTVQLQFKSAGVVLQQHECFVRGGVADLELDIEGDGPFELSVCLASDTSNATTLLIDGRPSIFKETLLSGLGTELYGSMEPSKGARVVRGLHVHEGGLRTTPIHLEQVSDTRVRITPMTAVESLCVVVSDPTCPRIKPDMLLTAEVSHPALSDSLYQDAESLFQNGQYQQACTLFEKSRSHQQKPHPYYAYYIACCLAREGDYPGALRALKQAFDDGWADPEQLEDDEDLSVLKDHQDFISLLHQGQRVWTHKGIKAGQSLDFEIPSVVSVVSVGAFIDGRAWEGWGNTLTPSLFEATLHVPEHVEPGATVSIEVEAEHNAAVYLLVKDARHASDDHASNRLAGQLKMFMQASAEGQAGWVSDTLHDAISPKKSLPFRFGHNAAVDGPGPVPDPSVMASMYASRPLIPTEQSITSTQAGLLSRHAVEASGVLMAQLFQADIDGRIQAEIVAENTGDLLIEAFVAHNGDWDWKQSKIKVRQTPSARFQMPPYVHTLDCAVGWLEVRFASGQGRVSLECDGQPVALLLDTGRALDTQQVLEGRCVMLSFQVKPGRYSAFVSDQKGNSRRVDAVVEEPGVSTTTMHHLKVLASGESVSLGLEATARSLVLLDSFEAPMRALVESLCVRSSLNCEQIAARAVAASVLWFWDTSQRRRAEAVVHACIERLKEMWIPEMSGFKSYPNTRREPDRRYGLRAARHLMLLAQVVLDSVDVLTPPMKGLCEDARNMALDVVNHAQNMQAGTVAMSSEQVYMAAVRGESGVKLLERIDHLTPAGTLPPVPSEPELFGNTMVARRAEACYAAAACLRLGSEVPRALSLMNQVMSKRDEHGALYSTLDSVAALMMLHEARRSELIGAADVEVNGQLMSLKQACSHPEPIQTFRCLQGCAALEIGHAVTRNWNVISMNNSLSIRVALEKGGRASRRFVLGEVLELVVVLAATHTPEMGDVLWVCLPDALSRMMHGAHFKKFVVDFRGQRTIRVPLAATAVTYDADGLPASQRFVMSVRNMYDETRGANPGGLEFMVVPV